ncbi:MAG: hypothetical protein ACYSSN_07975 [Planctomycetota bacterium]|jgi:hypothetical protein
MRPAENIKRLIRDAEIKINPEVKASALKELVDELQKPKTIRSAETMPNFWRKIMKNPISRLTVAAVVIIAVMVAINQLGDSIGGTSVAWAEVAEKIDLMPAFVNREKRIATSDGKEIPFLRSDVVGYHSPKYGLREDMHNEDGLVLHRVYSLWLVKKSITIQPALKQYKVVDIDNAKLEQFRANIKKLVKPIKSGDYKKLGRKKIDGIEVEGIEISDPDIMAGAGYPIKFDSLILRLWADVGTSLIYRLEAEATTSDKYVTQFTDGKPVEIKSITTEFQWDVEFDKSVFEPNIPADYTLMPQ